MRPLLRHDCKELIKGKYKAIVIDGEEVDDAVIWMGYEYLAKGYEVVIVTSDKDANAYSGLSLFNYTLAKPEIVLIPELGELHLDDKNKVRGLGFLFYCFQLLNGDSTDNFKPSELSGNKFGEKSAYALLKDCKSKQEALTVVIKQYKEWYPIKFKYKDCFNKKQDATWLTLISLYHQCVRMKETKDDKLDFKSFALRYGISPKDLND